MKCLIIWSIVVFLVVCVSAEDNQRSSMAQELSSEEESIEVAQILPLGGIAESKAKTTVRTNNSSFIYYN